VSTTAPDFYPIVKDLPRVQVEAGATLELLVLAAGDHQCAGVDLTSGTLVRGWSTEPTNEPIRAYDVVEVTLGGNPDAVPDPSEPEALGLSGPPHRIFRMKGRRAERLIRPLLHPTGQPLLGISASAVPFWERRPDHPSIAVVEPKGPITLWRQGRYLSCHFHWQGHERELPCLDRLVAARMDRVGQTRLAASKGSRLVVALTPPIDGRCHKVVEAVLARP
jgi:hypothetical protein